VVTGSLEDFLSYDGDFATSSRFNRPNQINSTIMSIPPGYGRQVWTTFTRYRSMVMRSFGGDSRFLEAIVGPKTKRWQDMFPGQLVSYKKHVRGGPLRRSAPGNFRQARPGTWTTTSSKSGSRRLQRSGCPFRLVLGRPLRQALADLAGAVFRWLAFTASMRITCFCRLGTSSRLIGAILLALAGAAIALRMRRCEGHSAILAAASFAALSRSPPSRGHRRAWFMCAISLPDALCFSCRSGSIARAGCKPEASHAPLGFDGRRVFGAIDPRTYRHAQDRHQRPVQKECLYRNELTRRARHLLWHRAFALQSPPTSCEPDCYGARGRKGQLPLIDSHLAKASAAGATTLLISAESFAMTIFFHKLEGETYEDCGRRIALHRAAARPAARGHAETRRRVFRRQDKFLNRLRPDVEDAPCQIVRAVQGHRRALLCAPPRLWRALPGLRGLHEETPTLPPAFPCAT
jgi:hypothetical protein